MRVMRRWRLLLARGGALVCLALGGCQGSGHPATQGSGGAGGGSGGESTGSGGSSATGGTTMAGGTNAAGGTNGSGAGGTGAGGQSATNGGTTASSITIADHWSTGFFGTSQGPVMAAIGAEAAVAYIGQNANDPNSVVPELRVQRIDAQGMRTGSVIAKTLSGRPGSPTIASNNQLYAICWDVAGQIDCVSMPAGQGELQPLYSGVGFAPAIVHGDAGWLIAWRASQETSTTIVLQRIGTRLEAIGTPVSFPSTNASPVNSSSSFAITASDSGFVLVTGDPVRAQRLDATLGLLGTAIDLKTKSFWSFVSLAATDRTIAFGLGEPYAAMLSVVDANNQVTVAMLPGGIKEGMPIALLADRGTLAGLWSTPSGSQEAWHFQHPLEQAPASVNALGAGGWSFNSRFGLNRIGDTYFAAMSQTGAEIEILRLGK